MRPNLSRILSSWWLFAALLLGHWASYLYFSLGEAAYHRWTHFLLKTPLGLGLYLGLVFVVISVSLRIAREKFRRERVSGMPEDMDVTAELPPGPLSAEALIDFIKRQGFSVKVTDGVIIGRKGRYSLLPGTMLRLGLAILMISILASVHLRKTDEAIFHKGEEKELLGRKIMIEDIMPGLPEEILITGEKDAFRLERVSASAVSSGRRFLVTPAFPVSAGSLYYRIVHMGIAQKLSAKSEGTDFDKVADLDLFPPEKTDTLNLSGNLTLSVSLHPEKTYKKGLVTGKLFPIATPLYHVSIRKDKSEPIETGTVKPGGKIQLGDFTVSAGDTSVFTQVRAVHDPALIAVYAGIVTVLTGLLLIVSRFFWYEKEFRAVRGKMLYLGYREEFYKKWGIQKFLGWKKKLTEMTIQ